MNKLEKALAEAGYEKMESIAMPGYTGIVIKPLRKVEKQEYCLRFFQTGVFGSKDINTAYAFTPTQAEKVAAFLGAGMEYVAGKDRDLYKLTETVISAREALEGTE